MKSMNMNKLIKGNSIEDLVYGQTVEIPSLGISMKKYISIAQKLGLAKRILAVTYDLESNTYDGVNAKILIPVYFIEEYSDEIEFPSKIEELDAVGIYDYLMVSGALSEINAIIGSELKEVISIIHELVKIKYIQLERQNPIADFLGDIGNKNPEDVDKMMEQAKTMMGDNDFKDMIKFRDNGVN